MKAIKNVASILLLVIGGVIAVAVVGVGVHLWNHAQLRHDVLFDRQVMLHSSDAFHVVSAISLAPGQDLLDGVRRYVDGVGAHGAEVVYAGKLAFPAPRKSRQMPDFDWDAFVIAQYPTRDAWEAASSRDVAWCCVTSSWERPNFSGTWGCTKGKGACATNRAAGQSCLVGQKS